MRILIEFRLTASHGRTRFVSSIWDFLLQEAATSRRMSAKFWTALVGKGSLGGPFTRTTQPPRGSAASEEDTDDDDRSTLTGGASVRHIEAAGSVLGARNTVSAALRFEVCVSSLSPFHK